MMHAWYSNQHDLQCGTAVYLMDGKPRPVTFVCSDRERGERYVKERLAHFPDYVYIGIVGRFLTEDKPRRLAGELGVGTTCASRSPSHC